MVAKSPPCGGRKNLVSHFLHSQHNRTAASILAAIASPSSISGDLQPVGDWTLSRDRWFALPCGVFMVKKRRAAREAEQFVLPLWLLWCFRFRRSLSLSKD